VSDERRTLEPHDRLTRLCDAMTRTLEVQDEYDENVRCVVMLDDGSNGGIVLHGYEDDGQAAVDMLMHLRAIFRANGGDLTIVPFGGSLLGREAE
jgi:hypothetical protein